jgi:hypothetical protein
MKAVIEKCIGRADRSARPAEDVEAHAFVSAGAPVGSIVSIEDVSIEDISIEDSGLILNQAT